MSEPYWEPLAAASSLIAVSSTPPASPADGQIWYYAPFGAGVATWAFRYNAGSAAAYKWEFVGGPPAYYYPATNVSTSSTTYGTIDGTTPSSTIARAGVYLFDYGASAYNTAAAGANYLGLYCGGVLKQQSIISSPTTGSPYLLHRGLFQVIAAANDVAQLQYKVLSGTGTWEARYMSYVPIAIA